MYCGPPSFGRSKQEDKHKGDDNKRAKYGLTVIKDQITLHLRLFSGKPIHRVRPPNSVQLLELGAP